MPQIGRSDEQPNENLRLPQVVGVPSLDNLQVMLARAQRNSRNTVELCCSMPDTGTNYILTIKCDLTSGKPGWMLYRNELRGSSLIRSYTGSDIFMIRGYLQTDLAIDEAQSEFLALTNLADPVGSKTIALSESSAGELGEPADSSTGASRSSVVLNKQDISEGDLSNFEMDVLLKSCAAHGMTGRLGFRRNEERGEIFFANGTPTHAATSTATGDQAILEILIWQNCDYRWFAGETAAQPAINRSLDELLAEGRILLEQTAFLINSGVSGKTYLVRKNAGLSDEDLKLTLLDRYSSDLPILMDLYKRIDDTRTLSELLREQPMPRTQWISLLHTLNSRDLVSFTDIAPESKLQFPQPIPIERSLVESAVQMLTSETGLITYPAFLFFLQQEHKRFRRGGQAFSLLIFEIWLRDSQNTNALKPLPDVDLREVASHINSAKRDLDMFAHFSKQELALLLPHTNLNGAATFARNLNELISESTKASSKNLLHLVSFFGAAGIPEDCEDPELLLAAAKQAKDLARSNKTPLILFKDRNFSFMR